MVTGGAGYMGCRLVPALVAAGHRVTVVDKLTFGDAGLARCRHDIELHPLDIRNVDGEHLTDVEAVVHLAGLSNDPTAEISPEANRSINLEATLRLARLAKKRGVRKFVFASSCSVYHTKWPDDDVRDETSEIDPTAPYSWSKHQAEIGLLALGGSDFCPVILRKGTIYGASPRMRFDLVVNAFTCDAFAKGRLTVHAGGRMWRPLLHIEDAVAAYCRVLDAEDERVHGKVFNVLNDNYRVLDIARDVRRTIRESAGVDVELDVQQVGVSRSYRVNAHRIRNELGFTPGNGLDAAVAGMWSMLESGIDPEDAIYYNVRWIETLAAMEERSERMSGSAL